MLAHWKAQTASRDSLFHLHLLEGLNLKGQPYPVPHLPARETLPPIGFLLYKFNLLLSLQNHYHLTQALACLLCVHWKCWAGVAHWHITLHFSKPPKPFLGLFSIQKEGSHKIKVLTWASLKSSRIYPAPARSWHSVYCLLKGGISKNSVYVTKIIIFTIIKSKYFNAYL